MVKTAILVDGGFYKTRAKTLFGDKSAEDRATELERYCLAHIYNKNEKNELYRVFYYDCPPLSKKAYHPFLKMQIDLSQTPLYKWNTSTAYVLKSISF